MTNRESNDNKQQAYLFIVAGPTGSGKSGLPGKIKRYMNLGENKYVDVVIDNLVEKSVGYKKKVIEIVKGECGGKKRLCSTLKKNINALTPTLLNKFSTAYFNSRKMKNCKTGTSLTSERSSKSCDAINNAIFKNGLLANKDIIFETQGEYYPDWIFKTYKEELKDYKIIMAWSITSFNELVRRNKGRALIDMKKFLRGAKKAPRLPDVRRCVYKKSVMSIQKTFEKTIKKCVKRGEECGPNIIYLVFDNTKPVHLVPFRVIYDSTKKSLRNVGVMKNLLKIPGNSTRGKRKIRKSKRGKSKKVKKGTRRKIL